MRRAALVVLLLCLALAAAAPVASAAGGPRLAEAAGVRFPDRAFALTLPSARSLDVDAVSVRENGRPVEGVSVVPADGAGAYRFGVVLVVDVSSSMRGRPLQAAQQAARAFVRQRRPGQPVAVLTFARDIELLQPFTTDAAVLDRSLAAIGQGGGGSRILDAAAQAIDLIRAARMTSASVVLLSDGADYRSRTDEPAAAAAARRANARVFTIGLRSASHDFGALNLLAADTRGEFSSAAVLSDLARIYDRLGSRLAHQYVVQYRSTAAPDRSVRVDVRVRGVPGVAAASYRTPALAAAVGAPFRRSAGEGIWLSPIAAVVVSLFAAALLVLCLWLLLRPRDRSVRERMADYVSPVTEESDAADGAGAAAVRSRAGAERSLQRTALWGRLNEKLELARISLPATRLATFVALATGALLVLPAATGAPAVGVLALGCPFAAWVVIQRRVAAQRRLFADQLPDNLQIIASAMRAGHSFAGALAVVVDDAPQPTRRELERVIADEQLGVPLDGALRTVAQRMDSKDLEQVALVAALQRETGGNTAEVLDQVTANVRERAALRRTVQTLTAQGRMSRWLLSALPVVLLAVTTVFNPTYVAPLYETGIGNALLAVTGVMVVSGSLVIKRIVNIEV